MSDYLDKKIIRGALDIMAAHANTPAVMNIAQEAMDALERIMPDEEMIPVGYDTNSLIIALHGDIPSPDPIVKVYSVPSVITWEGKNVPVYVSGEPWDYRGESWISVIPEDETDDRIFEYSISTGRIVRTV